MPKDCVVMFAKSPEKNKCKTRLAHTIGQPKANKVYERILTRLIKEHSHQDYDLIFYVKGDTEYFERQNLNVKTRPSNSLGEEMYWCMFDELMHYKKVLITCSDLPTLNQQRIKEALDALDNTDIVLGPGVDGGYYLVGLKEPLQIFDLKEWSHENVLKETLELIKKLDKKHVLLPIERDIDTFEDLEFYQKKGVL